ncbi:MAG: hypothetical protein EHM28_00785 [Spirochaetaceae bacterium]|nr:MAG: hypothetical protein EHM28_00785 [Spirochaetaceae bacterium]
MRGIAVCILFACVLTGCSNSTQFEHKVSPSGTGQLFMQGREVPPVFDIVIADSIIYNFQAEAALTNIGYWPKEQWNIPESESTAVLSEDERDRGWYFADISSRKTSTPFDWIWVKAGAIRAYVDRQKLVKFLQEYGDRLPDLNGKRHMPLPAG